MSIFSSLAFAALSIAAASPAADTLTVSTFRSAGPFPISRPYQIDSLDNNGKAYKAESVLEAQLPESILKNAAVTGTLPSGEGIGVLGFSLQSSGYTHAGIIVEGLKDYKMSIDGKTSDGKALKLEPGTHEVSIRYLCGEPSDKAFSIRLTGEKGKMPEIRTDGGRIYSLDINSMGVRCGGATVSPSGRLAAIMHTTTKEDGKQDSYTEIVRIADGALVLRTGERIHWMPASDRYWFKRAGVSGKDLIAEDPVSGEETVLARNIPDGWFSIAPTEKFLIYSIEDKGPVEGPVHEIINPEDRQPGWRNRSHLAEYDLATGIMQPLTYGYHNTWLCDISDDGGKILFMTSRMRFTERPTTLFSLYLMHLSDLSTECLVEDDGFIGSSATFSPDGSKVLVTGSPEAFKGVGMDVKPGQTPNMFDIQLFVLNIADRKVNPITKSFNPSVLNAVWCRADGKIYLTAENKDMRSLYRMDPLSGKAEDLKAEEDYIISFDIARDAAEIVYYGESLENASRAHAIDCRKGRHQTLYDFHPERLGGVTLGKGGEYEFTSSRGDRINGFYLLPPDFDPSKKYPMLVHYYGGCSPSSRYCIGAYSPQYYAGQGYIFYVVNPSGAAGFGQEFAARHVNTAGDVVADDIIEGVQNFCKDHPYVDTKHIGCFSASYGGFMTQLLLTKTDIFATGISHAGISSHTSYWGEGYWGYSYSETSMANSYPWTRKDLYVDHSPLYNADKFKSPILFLHGSADTNVPVGESIQMFTALKLLGKDTAFVMVDGEDHGVADYAKRRDWLRTISAWFAKYLKEDATWWNDLYPEKNL